MKRRVISLTPDELNEIDVTLARFAGSALHQGSVADARTRLARRRADRVPYTDESVVISDTVVQRPWGAMTVRSYVPPAVEAGAVVIYCHGGGWVMGRPDDFDATCAALARGCGMRVLAADYRLAPEHKFPSAIEDVLAVILASSARRPVLVGESAGGTLAISAAMACRDEGIDVATLVLYYPVTSYVGVPNGDRSRDTPLLAEADLAWCWAHYLPEPGDRLARYAAPGDTGDLGGLPPTLVIHGDRDPVGPDVVAFCEKLANAGVAVEEWVCKGLPHAFTALRGSQTVRDITGAAAVWLRTAAVGQSAHIPSGSRH